MAIEFRACRGDELGAAFAPLWHYFGRSVSDDDVRRLGRILPADRVYAAWDEGVAVGGAGAYAFEMSVPGGASVPTAGVMAVGVLPTHRRRGILTELMRRQLGDVHARGEPLAMLYASEGAIYGRYGYGIASFCGEMQLARERARFHAAFEPRATIRLVGEEEALELFPPIYERVRAQRAGMLSRTREWWEVRRFRPRLLATGGENVYAVVELDGEPQAYAIYHLHWAADHGASATTLEVAEALAASPEAMREVWTYLFAVDWIETIAADFLPLDHPLFFLVDEPRRMKFTLGEALWVRLVDVGAALSARSYATAAEVVFDVRDEFCPWNSGRWRLAEGDAERTDADAELALNATELGSVYLGGVTFDQLAGAGRLEELKPGAVARADALFRTPRQPWCPELF